MPQLDTVADSIRLQGYEPTLTGRCNCHQQRWAFGEMQRLRTPHAAARAVDIAGLVGDILSGELEIMEASWAS
jgi:hypothetical protein